MLDNISDADCLSVISLLYSDPQPVDNSSFIDDYRKDDSYERFSYIIDHVINPTACIIGFVGNLMNVVLMVRSACRRNTTTGDSSSVLGLTALSSVDITCCCVLFLASIIPHSVIFSSDNQFLMRFSMYKTYAVNAATRSSSWLTVLLALMRYAVICRPLQTRHLISFKALGIAITSVVVSSYLAELPALWTYSITEVDCSGAFDREYGSPVPLEAGTDTSSSAVSLVDYDPGIPFDSDRRLVSFLGKLHHVHPAEMLENDTESRNIINNIINHNRDDDDDDDVPFGDMPILSQLVRAGMSYVTTDIHPTKEKIINKLRVIPSFYLLFSGPFLTNSFFKTSSIIAWFIFGFFGPMCVLIFCNYHLVIALRRSRHMAKLYRHDASTRCSVENRLTFTFVCIISVYVLFVCPSELVTFVLHFVDVNHQKTAAPILTITNCLQTFNYTFNFVMYSFPNLIFKESCSPAFFRRPVSSRDVETPISKVPHSAVSHVQKLVLSRVVVNDAPVDTGAGVNDAGGSGARRSLKVCLAGPDLLEMNGFSAEEWMKRRPDQARN